MSSEKFKSYIAFSRIALLYTHTSHMDSTYCLIDCNPSA